MANQDDLAALFSRNLSFNPYVAPLPEQQPDVPYYPSMSAHLVYQQPPRPASEPPQTDQLTTEIILNRHGVDSATLAPSQIALFKSAEASQQMRLIELWRIYPPTPGTQHDLGPSTSFQQEEAMAKLRYERQMLEERMSRTNSEGMEHEDSMSDGSSTTPMPITPIQGGDSRWSGSAEPYITSGYETLAQQEHERSTTATPKDIYSTFGNVGGPEHRGSVSAYEALAQREYEQSAAATPKDVYSHFGTAVGGSSYRGSTDPVYNTADTHTYPNVGGDWTKLMEYRQLAMENQYGNYTQQQHQSPADDEMMM